MTRRRGSALLSAIPGGLTMMDSRTSKTHLIAYGAAVAGRRVGRYLAVCGCSVLAASMAAPESGVCQRCVDRLYGTQWRSA